MLVRCSHPENPEKSVPSQKTPEKRRKTPINHAKKAYLEKETEGQGMASVIRASRSCH
jgi:hypothetical protein